MALPPGTAVFVADNGLMRPVHARSVSAGQVTIRSAGTSAIRALGAVARKSSWPGACASVSMLNTQPMSRAAQQVVGGLGVPDGVDHGGAVLHLRR